MEKGLIRNYNVKIGDKLDVGALIGEVETDKSAIDWESNDKGIIAKILKSPDESVEIGKPVMVLAKNASDINLVDKFLETLGESQKNTPEVEKIQEKVNIIQPKEDSKEIEALKLESSRVLATPAAKMEIKSRKISPQVDSKIANMIQLKTNSKEIYNKKLTVTDFMIKALAKACIRFPKVIYQWSDEFLIKPSKINVSVAVATEAGLFTPVITDADKKPITLISDELKDLVSRAKTMKLKPEEYQSGTISLSNLGMIGIESFQSIINPPQSAILSIGSVKEKLIMDENEEIQSEKNVTLTLGCDHRVIDGMYGGQFLMFLKSLIEEPGLMLIE
ncbi:MAG: hypothetical protein MHPSP_001399 [Paramarteilia canceri]